MLNVEVGKFKQAIMEQYPDYGEHVAEEFAKKIISSTDARLEENVLQWVNHEPISELWFGKYCINAIMSIQKNQDFLYALEAMNLYLMDESAGVQKIWRAKK